MKRFNNLLFVSHGLGQDREPIEQALFFTHTNKSNLNVLILYPVLPNQFDEYQNSYEENLLSNMRKQIKNVIEEKGYNNEEIQQYITYRIESCNTPIDRIVQHVLRDEYDVVMKQIESHESPKGFKAMDMGLMRKCPCPVWLYYPNAGDSTIKHIAVAIDPESPELAGADLAEHLLKLGSDLANQFSAKLSVVSCWNYAYEETMRDSDFAAIPEDTLQKIVVDAKDVHYATLQTIIKSSKIAEDFDLQHIKGLPSKVIPEFVSENEVDLLIMGTVARTGIPGFLMGNTAEDLLQKIDTTLLALKPAGFVTPVKPF